MKIALVVPGGVARTPEDGWIPGLHWLIVRLARRHEVHVFSLRGAPRPDRYPFAGATVHHAGARPTRLRTLAAILAEQRRGPFAVLHGIWVTPAGVLSVAAGALLRRPVIVHVTGGELVALPDIQYGGLSTLRARFWTRLGLAATRLTTPSESLVRALAARGRTATRIPLGVARDQWPPRPPRTRDPAAPARLVHVGDLNPVKDQGTLLEAARRLAAAGVAFTLDIAGRDTLRGALQAQAERLGLGAHVRFHGLLSHERVYALVESADVFWLSSRHEAGPLAFLEAAVLGVPTVGTAVGHVAEWAPDGAVSVAVGDAEGLARETARLLRDEGRRQALALEAQRRAIACDADWTAHRFEALYDELVRTGRRRERPA